MLFRSVHPAIRSCSFLSSLCIHLCKTVRGLLCDRTIQMSFYLLLSLASCLKMRFALLPVGSLEYHFCTHIITSSIWVFLRKKNHQGDLVTLKEGKENGPLTPGSDKLACSGILGIDRWLICRKRMSLPPPPPPLDIIWCPFQASIRSRLSWTTTEEKWRHRDGVWGENSTLCSNASAILLALAFQQMLFCCLSRNISFLWQNKFLLRPIWIWGAVCHFLQGNDSPNWMRVMAVQSCFTSYHFIRFFFSTTSTVESLWTRNYNALQRDSNAWVCNNVGASEFFLIQISPWLWEFCLGLKGN